MLCEDIKLIPLVKSIKIRDFRIIKKADITFKKGLNLIKGKNGYGKTTLLDYLASKYEARTLNGFSAGELMTLACVGIAGYSKGKGYSKGNCFLIDDLCHRLDQKHLNLVLKAFSKSKNQIVVVVPDSVKTKNLKANVIDSNRFILDEMIAP